MSEILLEIAVCIFVSLLIMIMHELPKSIVYKIVCKGNGCSKIGSHSIFEVWRYIDPVGIILSVTCYAPVSKPHMFRIREKNTNLILGITGFAVNILLFTGSVIILRYGYGGESGIFAALNTGIVDRILVLAVQYIAILSFGMFVVNLFPVSTFDMGLIIAGISARYYLNIIKSDSVIKLILMITLLLDIIHYACIRMLNVLL